MPASRLNIATNETMYFLSRYLDAAWNDTALCVTRDKGEGEGKKRKKKKRTMLGKHSNRSPRASMSVNYRAIGHEGLHTFVIFQTFKAKRECSQHFTGANLFVNRLCDFYAFVHAKPTGRKIHEKYNTCKECMKNSNYANEFVIFRFFARVPFFKLQLSVHI